PTDAGCGATAERWATGPAWGASSTRHGAAPLSPTTLGGPKGGGAFARQPTRTTRRTHTTRPGRCRPLQTTTRATATTTPPPKPTTGTRPTAGTSDRGLSGPLRPTTLLTAPIGHIPRTPNDSSSGCSSPPPRANR